MMKPGDEEHAVEHQDDSPRPFRVRLPGFVAGKEVGLGDAIKRMTSAVGIGPCGGCQRRAETLNTRVVLVGRRAR
jgi:hypothetical protein